jgi:hypothetical protein
MGILDWLIGSKANERRSSTPQRQPVHQTSDAGATRSRPFEIVAAEQRWNAGNSRPADDLFRQGIDEYKRRERSGLDVASGLLFERVITCDRPVTRCQNLGQLPAYRR